MSSGIPHIERIVAYILPNVIRLLEPRALGLPPPIKRLHPDEGKKLAAVLAREIAVFSEAEMLNALRCEDAPSRNAELIAAMGDTRYEHLTEERRMLCKRLNLLEERERALAERAATLSDRSDRPPKRAQIGPGPYGMKVCWRYDLWPASVIDGVRTGIAGCKSLKRRLRQKAAACDSSIHDVELEIVRSPEFRRKHEMLRSKRPALLDFSRPGFRLTGALELLIDHEACWWGKFQERLEHQVEKDRRRAPHKIAMRIPGFSQAVQEIVTQEKQTYSGAATLVLERSGIWSKSPTTAAINLMRETLRTEDSATVRWLTDRDALWQPYGERVLSAENRHIGGFPSGAVKAMLLAHALADGRRPAAAAVFIRPVGCDVDAVVKYIEDWWTGASNHRR